jgi:putative transcriptional regulator
MPTKKPGRLRNQIRRLRFDQGAVTQRDLAEGVAVTRQTIIALQAGRDVPPLLRAFRRAAAFGARVGGMAH